MSCDWLDCGPIDSERLADRFTERARLRGADAWFRGLELLVFLRVGLLPREGVEEGGGNMSRSCILSFGAVGGALEGRVGGNSESSSRPRSCVISFGAVGGALGSREGECGGSSSIRAGLLSFDRIRI